MIRLLEDPAEPLIRCQVMPSSYRRVLVSELAAAVLTVGQSLVVERILPEPAELTSLRDFVVAEVRLVAEV